MKRTLTKTLFRSLFSKPTSTTNAATHLSPLHTLKQPLFSSSSHSQNPPLLNPNLHFSHLKPSLIFNLSSSFLNFRYFNCTASADTKGKNWTPFCFFMFCCVIWVFVACSPLVWSKFSESLMGFLCYCFRVFVNVCCY